MKDGEKGMNNDPGAAGRDAALALRSLTADILDIAGSSHCDFWRGKGVHGRDTGLLEVLGRGLGTGDECWRNAFGMSDGAF